jgi:hypothetical protein
MSTKKIFLRLINCVGLLMLFITANAQHITTLVASPTNPPGAPGPVTGNSSVLQGSTLTYTVTAASGATSYSWSLSNSSAGTITGTTTSASVHWSSTFTGAVYVVCTAVNAVGSTQGPVLYVQVTQPVTPLVSGVISPALQNNKTPSAITSTPPSGGNGIYSYQWQSSLNNSAWVPISTGLTSSYTPQNQTASTYYRLVTTSGSASVTSNTAFVNTMVSASYSPSNNIVSVNESTGTANVVIPIYTIQAAHVTFPINLVYSATGVKGTDNEQNAGMGWNVSLGGAVTRQLRGLPDDVTKDGNGNGALGWIYANNGQSISNMQFINDNNTATCNDETSDISTINGAILGNSDTEPDIFQVNAPGLSCKLVFDANNAIRVIPYQDLKVSYTTGAQGATNQGQITGFTITNDQGITYIFGATATVTQKATTTQSSVNYFQSNYNHFKNGITYYSSWGLMQISDVHNNSINITYTAAPVSSYSNPVQLSVGGGALNTLYTMAGSITSQLISGIFCTNNVGGNGQAFQITYVNAPSSGNSCISNITGMGHFIIFGYNNVTLTGSNYFRLFLNSVIDQTCSAQTVNGQTVSLSSYAPLNLTFNYLNTTNSTTTLACPNSVNLDYWGYTNGTSNNTTSLLPTIDINPSTTGYERYRNRQTVASPASIYIYAFSGNNRQADQTSLAGTLSQINYSAGGYTALSYEPNQYYDNTLQTNVLGAGIRVKQILDHDGISTDNDFIKTYTYRNLSTGISTGKPISLPVFAFTVPYSGTNTGSALWASSTAVSPYDLSPEDHTVLYSAVTETVNNTGSTQYQYSLPATNWDTTVPVDPSWSPAGLPSWHQTLVDVGRSQGAGGSCAAEGVLRNDVNTYPFPPNTNYDFETGLLTNVLTYNNTGTQVSETDYYYQTPETPVDITALKYDANNYSTNYAKYTIHTSAGPLVTQTVNKLFDLTNVSPGTQPTAAQVVTINNVYNSVQHKLSQQSVINSDGSINTVNIKYSKDYPITTADDSYTSNLLALQNLNLNIPVETYTQFTPVNSTQAVTTGADLTLFGTFPNQGVDYLQYGRYLVSATVINAPGPAPVQHRKFIAASGVANFSPSSVSNSNTFQYDSRYFVTENDLGYDYSGFLLSKDDGFQHIKTTIYDNFNTYRLRAVFNNVRFDQVGMDFPMSFIFKKLTSFTNSPNAYDFSESPNSPVSNLAVGTVTRNGVASLALPASEILTKSVSKNTAAVNYIFSLWVNSSNPGIITVNATDGTNTVSVPFNFSATVGNSSYPTGFQYCRVTIPMASLTASSTITLNFSSNQNINCTDILIYPDIADVVLYSYDSNNNKIAETNGNGVSTYFSYDGLGRLLYVYDQDNNIIERKTYVNNNTAINNIPGLIISIGSQIPCGAFCNSCLCNYEQVNFYTKITSANSCIFNSSSIYTWNFGDGTTYNGVAPTHNYIGTKGQQFTCTLTITSPQSAAPFSTSTVVTL